MIFAVRDANRIDSCTYLEGELEAYLDGALVTIKPKRLEKPDQGQLPVPPRGSSPCDGL